MLILASCAALFETLVQAGFDMREIEISSTDPGTSGLHINPLEFIGCLINLWITLKCIMLLGLLAGGYVIGLLADNTTALSWMSTAARTHEKSFVARFGSSWSCSFC